MAAEDVCPIPYPDRFHAAVDFVTNPHPEAKALSEELRLLLFALYKQATQGPCNEPKPWSWNVIETAKWQGWNQLGTMSRAEAMRHYVHQLEQNQSDWWSIVGRSNEQEQNQIDTSEDLPSPEDTEEIEKTKARQKKIKEATSEGSWSTPYLSDASKPLPRYEHGVAYINEEMFIVGGNCAGGRYLNDVWSFDFTSLAWTAIACRSDTEDVDAVLPPIAGHTLVPWNNTLLVVGGHVKSKDMTEKMTIRALDLSSMTWSVVKTTGSVPAPRGGHSVTLMGHRLYVFGGEDMARRPLNDFFELNLESLEWKDLSSVKNTPPAARSAHVSIGYCDRYLLFFGGGSMATCFDDLIVFDTERSRWHTATVKGRRPSPRAGHSAAVLDDRWYIVGGGNNASGCTDMAYLDLSQLNIWPMSMRSEEEDSKVTSSMEGPDLDEIDYKLQWTIVGTIPDRSYLASEGMSLISIQDARVLVAFGGYNGKYSNAVSLFRPRGETPVYQPSLTPSASKAAEEDALDRSKEDTELLSLQAKLDAVTKNATAAKESASQEMAILRRQLISAQTMLQEKDEALEHCKAELSTEQDKVMRLEAEKAELRIKAGKATELERELESYRRQKQMPGTKSGGIWGWVAGE